MRNNFYLLLYLVGLLSCSPTVQDKVSYAQTGSFQLATPQLYIDSVLFQKNATISLEMAHPNVAIRYTIDGSEVNTSSNLYKKPIKISKTGSLKAKAFHDDFLASNEIVQDFVKTNSVLENAKIIASPAPSDSYRGNGAAGLIDLQKGTTDFRKGKFWLGFQSRETTISIDLSEKQSFSNISLSLLKDHNSWIFLPKKVEIYADGKLIGTTTLEQPTDFEATQIRFIHILTEPIETENLQIKIINMEGIPDFHTGKGTLPWLFIDEILFE